MSNPRSRARRAIRERSCQRCGGPLRHCWGMIHVFLQCTDCGAGGTLRLDHAGRPTHESGPALDPGYRSMPRASSWETSLLDRLLETVYRLRRRVRHRLHRGAGIR